MVLGGITFDVPIEHYHTCKMSHPTTLIAHCGAIMGFLCITTTTKDMGKHIFCLFEVATYVYMQYIY